MITSTRRRPRSLFRLAWLCCLLTISGPAYAVDLDEPSSAETDPGAAADSNQADPAPESPPAPQSSAAEPDPKAAGDASMTFLPLDPFSVFFGFHGGVSWLNSNAARNQRIEDVGGSFYISGGFVVFDLVTVTGSLGAIFPSDNAGFSQSVEPLFGGEGFSAGSELQVTNYSIAAGLRTPSFCLAEFKDGSYMTTWLLGSYGTSAIGGDRFISDCGDCHSEDLEFNDGSFIEFETGITLSASIFKIGLTTSFRHYFAGAGVEEELRFGLVSSFF